MNLVTDNERVALEQVSRSLATIPDVLRIVVFGSRVRGDFRESSDLDVLILVTRMETDIKKSIIHLLHDIELEHEVPLSPILLTKNEYEVNRKMGSGFIERVEREGIVLYDGDETRKN